MRTQCSMPDCDKPPRYNQRYCAGCHSKYMKTWRAKRRREQEALATKVVELRAKLIEQSRELEVLRA